MLNGKKIIFILPSLEMGGSERQALLLAKYLKEARGASVEAWGVSSPGLGAILRGSRDHVADSADSIPMDREHVCF